MEAYWVTLELSIVTTIVNNKNMKQDDIFYDSSHLEVLQRIIPEF